MLKIIKAQLVVIQKKMALETYSNGIYPDIFPWEKNLIEKNLIEKNLNISDNQLRSTNMPIVKMFLIVFLSSVMAFLLFICAITLLKNPIANILISGFSFSVMIYLLLK